MNTLAVDNEYNQQYDGKFRILIADDDVDILESLEALLAYGCNNLIIKTATSVETATSTASSFQPEIALIDVKMGNKNGLDLVPVLRKILPESRCIMMTAFRDASYAATAVKYGAVDYLFKPIDPEAVLITVNRQIENLRSQYQKKEYQRRFFNIFDNSSDLLLLLDRSLQVIEANRAALDILDVTPDDLSNRQIKYVTDCLEISENGAELIKSCIQALNGQPGHGKIHNSELYLEFHVRPLDPLNADSMIVVQMRNITDNVVHQKYMSAQNKKLEKVVAKRTAELEHSLALLENENEARKLTEESLRIAKRAAEEANQAKSAFMSRASHHLRTPLNAILGFAQLLQVDNQNLTVDQQESVDEIIIAGEQLLNLINDVLEISKAESGINKPDIAQIDLNALVVTSISRLRPLFESMKVTSGIENNLDEPVYSDAGILGQIVINLLSNAVKYNMKGGHVTVSMYSRNKHSICLSVRDTGIGIPLQDQARIFDPFVRLEQKIDVPGSGNGLTVASKLVTLLGGICSVNSRPDEGSEFLVELPRSLYVKQ